MKTKYLFVILMIILVGVQFRAAAQIDKDQAIGIVKSSLTNEELQNYNVLVFPDLIQGKEFNLSPYHVLHSEYDMSWLFFIDMYPLAQWDHNCKYLFLDQQTGNYTTINYRIPPQDYWYGLEYVNTPYPYPLNNPLQGNNQGNSNIANPDPHKYAVFICWNENEPCRWNNLSHIYCGIKRNYGFMDDNIFVLSGNGNYDSLPSYNLDNFGNEQDFDGPCTKDNIEDVFNYLSQAMSVEDLLFVYATSHGGTIGNDTSYLRLNGQDSIFDYEVAALVNNIDCSQRIFGIDACYSGGFKDDLEGYHTVVQTCVSADTFSIIFSGFGFHDMSFWWGTALRGCYPLSKNKPWEDGPKIGEHDSLHTISIIDSTDFNPDDTLGGNNDGFIQFQEAFNFAYRYASDIRDRNGQNFINDGFIGDLLTLNGIEGRVDSSQYISGDFLIGRKLTLAPGTTLSNGFGQLNLFLNDSSEILVEDNASLNISGTNAKFYGSSGPSFVNIIGNVSAGYMNFQGDTNAAIHVNFNNASKKYALSHFSFENASVHSYCDSLSFSFTSFDHTPFEFTGCRLILNNTNAFYNSPLDVSGTYLTINATNDFTSSDLTLSSSSVSITGANNFTDSDIECSGDELYITGSNEFSNAMLDLSKGNIIISDSNIFNNSSVKIAQPLDEASFIEISNNSFDNDTTYVTTAVVTIEDYRNFQIDTNAFSYASGRGIELFYAGWEGRGVQQIAKNIIELKQPSASIWSDVGVHSYCSHATIKNNRIRENSYGLVAFHNSDINVLGDSSAYDYTKTQLIADNTRCQCLFNFASFPVEFHGNVFRDTVIYANQYHPFIKTVEYDELMQDTTGAPEWILDPFLDVTYNCWVHDSNLYDRLIPVGAYFYSPAWCPPGGEGHLKTTNIPQSIYYQAKIDIQDSNYLLADIGYKQLISEYPEDKYALASLKGLFALNPALHGTSYSSLKSYYDSLSLNPGDSLLGKTADWMSIRCDVENHHYQQAINSLDSILANPGTYADSVFALIDLGKVFAEMTDSAGLKASLTTRNPAVIPGTYTQFIAWRKDWVDLLLKFTETPPPNKSPNDKGIDEVMPCRFISVYPNPAANNLNVNYEVLHPGDITVKILTCDGQQFNVFDERKYKPGDYSLQISSAHWPNGCYLLSLSFNQVVSDARKLLVYH